MKSNMKDKSDLLLCTVTSAFFFLLVSVIALVATLLST